MLKLLISGFRTLRQVPCDSKACTCTQRMPEPFQKIPISSHDKCKSFLLTLHVWFRYVCKADVFRHAIIFLHLLLFFLFLFLSEMMLMSADYMSEV